MAFDVPMKKVECIKNLIAIIFVLIAAILIIPILFGVKPFIVMSGSMSPAVKAGFLAYIGGAAYCAPDNNIRRERK